MHAIYHEIGDKSIWCPLRYLHQTILPHGLTIQEILCFKCFTDGHFCQLQNWWLSIFMSINNDTLIEPYEEPIPPTLPCLFELTQFDDLHKYVDTENLQSKWSIQIQNSYLISYNNTVSMFNKSIVNLLFLLVNSDVKAVVIHAFPQKQQSNNTTRDFVIVNEE